MTAFADSVSSPVAGSLQPSTSMPQKGSSAVKTRPAPSTLCLPALETHSANVPQVFGLSVAAFLLRDGWIGSFVHDERFPLHCHRQRTHWCRDLSSSGIEAISKERVGGFLAASLVASTETLM